MFKILGLYVEGRSSKAFYAKILASVFYIFSPFLNETLYSHQLVFIYLVSILPATYFYLVKSIREKRIVFSIVSVCIFSIFSTTYASLPVTAAYLITLIPILFYEFWNEKKRFIMSLLTWVIIFFGLNFYWIIHLLYEFIYKTSLVSSVDLFSSGMAQQDNLRIITGVTRQYSPLNQIFNTIKSGTLTLGFREILNGLFLLVIIFAGSYISKLNNKKLLLYCFILLSLLLSWFLFSPNFSDWGPRIFISITKNFPLFAMFRNMHDKFALSLAFFYALTFGIGLSVIVNKININKIVQSIFIIFTLLLVTNIPRIINPSISDRDGLSRVSGDFNHDFDNLIDYLNTIEDDSRILWLPLNFPTYTNIQDNNGNYYTGLSPLRVLAGKSDFSGKFSFLTQGDIFLGDKLLLLLKQKDYKQASILIKDLNIEYVIVDNQQVQDSLKEFFYGGKDLPILLDQGESYKQEILGEKVIDFGTRYSLYKINPKSYISKIYTTDSQKVTYKKINSNEYKVTIDNLKENTNLVFLNPYNKGWTLYLLKNGDETVYKSNNSEVIFNYANVWKLDVYELKSRFSDDINVNSEGTVAMELLIKFEQANLNNLGYTLSILTLIVCILFILKK